MISTNAYTEQGINPIALNLQDETLANIVHELSNPMTTILGLSQLILEDSKAAGSSDQRIATINAEAKRSFRIIRNVLDLCKPGGDLLSARTLEGRALVDLNEAIRHSTALVEDQLERYGIALTVELPWRTPKVLSRPGELTQVFLNLITNSIQAIAAASGPCAITILGTQLGNRVCVTVEDDGPGFSEQDFARLFEPFFTTRRNGTGLGLNLSRKIVQDVGGDLWATRNPKHGAIFTVELPVEESFPVV